MPKMFIPEIGTTITLSKDWSFKLVYEERNSELLVSSGCTEIYCNSWRGKVVQINPYYPPEWLKTSCGAIIPRNIWSCMKSDFKDETVLGNMTTTLVVNSSLAKLSGPVTSTYIDDTITVGSSSIVLKGEFFPFIATIPKGTILKVDRVYIRKGMADYSSVSFIIEDSPDVRLLNKKKASKFNVPCEKPSVRFFAKLEDVNNLEFV